MAKTYRGKIFLRKSIELRSLTSAAMQSQSSGPNLLLLRDFAQRRNPMKISGTTMKATPRPIISPWLYS